MRINHSTSAMHAFQKNAVNAKALTDITEKLSSGYRIQRAKDDAAGLAISEKMRAQYRGLMMASKNSSDAISLVQTAEGALQESHSVLQRMRELAVQARSDTNSQQECSALNDEYQQLLKELDDTADKTKFNNQGVIDGTYGGKTGNFVVSSGATGQNFSVQPGANLLESGSYTLQASVTGSDVQISLRDAGGDVIGETTLSAGDIDFAAGSTGNSIRLNDGTTIQFDVGATAIQNAGDMAGLFGSGGTTFDFVSTAFQVQSGANQADEMKVNISSMDSKSLGIAGTAIATGEGARDAIGKLDEAINRVSSQRADLGATQNRLEYKINNLDTSVENLTAAESRIRDLDMASAMAKFTQKKILNKASLSMMAQANAASANVLYLLN